MALKQKYAELVKLAKANTKMKCVIEDNIINDSVLSLGEDGDIFICQNIISGSEADDHKGYSRSWVLCHQNETPSKYQKTVTSLEIAKKDIKDISCYEVGDILVDEDGDEKEVLAVIGNIVALSESTDGYMGQDALGIYDSWRTPKEIEEEEFSFKENEEEVEEITMDELCKRLGKTVKIKKD